MSDIKNIESWFSTRFENLFKEKRRLFNIPSIKIAIVDSVGSGVADVYFPNDSTNIISNVKLGTNVSVSIGDEVYLLCMNGSIGNSYILTNLTMASTSGGGTITNGSNIGTGGVGIFSGLLGSVMQFFKLRAGSSNITVTANGTLSTVDVDISSTPSFSTITSTVTTGTAPLTVTSTTKVNNLNVEKLDGYDAGHSTGQIPISDSVVNSTLYGQYTQEILNQQSGSTFLKTWYGTSAQYLAIGSKDASTMYFISG